MLVMLQHHGAPRALPDELGRLSYGYHMSDLYQVALIMTHRDGLPKFSASSVRCGDAGHRKACATPSESLGKPPLRSRRRPVGGRRKVLMMHRIACNFPPTRRAACAISMSHDQRSLVLTLPPPAVRTARESRSSSGKSGLKSGIVRGGRSS